MKTIRVLATLFLSSFTCIQSEGPHCFECSGVPYPRDCAQITYCGANELCSTEQFVTTSGHIVYNTGCRDKERCAAVSSELMGKRQVNITAEDTLDISTCVQCCNGNFCNNKGCGTEAVTLDQRGPYCYNCDSTLDPRSCTHVAVCQKNEECVIYLHSEFSGLMETVFRSHCHSRIGCEALSRAYSNYKCPPMCCNTDFCNDHCGILSNASMSTPAAYTTVHHTPNVITVQTTPSTTVTHAHTHPATTVKHTHTHHATTGDHHATTGAHAVTETSSTTHALHIASQHTPTTAGHSHNCGYTYLSNKTAHICVHVITEQRADWTSAQSQCKKEHGNLVVLDTHEKALLMRNWLIGHHGHYDVFWIGGRDIHHNDKYYWVNGNPIGSEADWSQGQPNHYHDEVQDCVSMSRGSSLPFQWHDTGCQHHLPFICEHKTI